MQLGPERGVGVAIAMAVATEQQDCGTCIKLLGKCIHVLIIIKSFSSIKDTLSPMIHV